MWSLHYGVKQSDNSTEDFVYGYSLPWELETISSNNLAVLSLKYLKDMNGLLIVFNKWLTEQESVN